MLNDIVLAISNFMYTYLLIIILLAGGFYFTFRTRFIQFRMFRFIERAETQRQVHLSGQQFRQRRTMRQITQFETQTRRLVVKSGHHGWKNALRGEIRDRDL